MSIYPTLYITRSKAIAYLIQNLYGIANQNIKKIENVVETDKILEGVLDNLLRDRLCTCKIVEDNYVDNNDNLL